MRCCFGREGVATWVMDKTEAELLCWSTAGLVVAVVGVVAAVVLIGVYTLLLLRDEAVVDATLLRLVS